MVSIQLPASGKRFPYQDVAMARWYSYPSEYPNPLLLNMISNQLPAQEEPHTKDHTSIRFKLRYYFVIALLISTATVGLLYYMEASAEEASKNWYWDFEQTGGVVQKSFPEPPPVVPRYPTAEPNFERSYYYWSPTGSWSLKAKGPEGIEIKAGQDIFSIPSTSGLRNPFASGFRRSGDNSFTFSDVYEDLSWWATDWRPLQWLESKVGFSGTAQAAFGSLGNAGSDNERDDTSNDIAVILDNIAEVDNLVVCSFATDEDSGTADGDQAEHTSIADTGGNTWTEAHEFKNAMATQAENGAVVSVWFSKISTQLGVGDNITLTITTNRDAKAGACWEFSILSTNDVVDDGLEVTRVDDNADPGNLNITGLANIEHLFIRVIACETNDTGYTASTSDAYTTFDHTNATSSGGGSGSNMGARGGFRIATETSNNNDPTWVTDDCASIVVSLSETVPAVNRFLIADDPGCTVTAVSTDTDCWSTTSNGATGASIPTGANDVFFDADSAPGSETVTMDANLTFNSLDTTGFGGTWALSTFELDIDETDSITHAAGTITIGVSTALGLDVGGGVTLSGTASITMGTSAADADIV